MPNEYVYTPPALISLSNPDTVVTEERLYQFYQQILPYLGGMPDILANKFSKADLYSTDEKLIGRWIDGKPLYQKTFAGITAPAKTTATITNEDLSIDRIIRASFSDYMYNGASISGTTFPYKGSQIWISNGVLSIYLDKDKTTVGDATIQYTKTTDSAVEIGDDTDYSTTEKIVGTWIDGKPVYQKTLECGTLPNNSTKSVAHGISDLAYVVSCEGFALNPTSNTLVPLPFVSTGSSRGIGVAISATNVELSTDYDRRGYTYAYVTIQYTKTSS